MRPPKVLDEDILNSLTEVFRAKGFEGASLKELADKTGLKKASLYHRFPNGKEEMALAVLSNAVKWGQENLLKTLSDESEIPEFRLKKGLDQIRTMYNYGEKSCVFRALSMKTGLELFDDQLRKGVQLWVTAFEIIGIALKFPSNEAEKLALDTLIEIQGSLVVATCFGNTDIFEKTLQNIENRYLSK